MKVLTVLLVVMIAGFASACERLVFSPTKDDYAAVRLLIQGKATSHLSMPSTELKTLRSQAKRGWGLEAFGVTTIGGLTLSDGFWFTKNQHVLSGSYIIRIYTTDSGKRRARLEFPAG
jgi:hypothetical protein